MKFKKLPHLKSVDVNLYLANDPHLFFSFESSKILKMVVYELYAKFRGPNFLPSLIERCPNIMHFEIHNVKLQFEWFLIFVDKVKELMDARGNRNLPRKIVISQRSCTFCKACLTDDFRRKLSEKHNERLTSYCLFMTQEFHDENVLIVS